MARCLAAVGVAAAFCLGLASCSSGPDPASTASAFLADWGQANYSAAGNETDAPEPAASFLSDTHDHLLVTTARLHLVGVSRSGSTATATFRADLQLAGIGTWSYRGRLPLRLKANRWRVVWSPADVDPALHRGDTLSRFRSLAPRASVLAGDGSVLVGPQPVVVVGLVPSAVHDLAATLATLARTTGIDPARVSALVARSPADEFVPVITLRQPAYLAVKPVIYPLAGVRFQQQTADLAPSPTFALGVLGRVGLATADALRQVGAPYDGTDLIGLSGLEIAFQHRLAGSPTGGVEIVDSQGNVSHRTVLTTGHPGAFVRTTLDPALQRAAEASLVGVSQPAALVAVRASSGEILAVANSPADSTFDRGLVGSYPPGSSFKVVTTTALLAGGLDPGTTVACPPRAVVDGKPFTNFEGEAPGPVSFSVDFAKSCNTAFVGLAAHLPVASLESAAASLGIGARWQLPLAAYSGQLPPPRDTAELAADAIGQGRVLVSPLTMALVAAAVDSGAWHAPVLTTDPAQAAEAAPTGGQGTGGLTGATAAQLRQLMRLVVTSGTGTAANLPGAPVYGKTGTAEFGPGNPPSTHAWFIGFRGDVAFAVIVEGGGVGGRVAAPIAARFLSASP